MSERRTMSHSSSSLSERALRLASERFASISSLITSLRETVRNGVARSKLPKHIQKAVSDSVLMSPSHAAFLVDAIPDRYKQASWKLAYSTSRDGISLRTLFRRVSDHSPTLLVVEDMDGSVFGAYASESWRISTKYYGTGETFVFKLSPVAKAYHWAPKGGAGERNDMFQFSREDCIAVGGGGCFALWLDEDLLRGRSAESPTFDKMEILPESGEEDFLVRTVEVWGLAL